MLDLPVGLIVIGVMVEVVLVGSMLIWHRASRKK